MNYLVTLINNYRAVTRHSPQHSPATEVTGVSASHKASIMDKNAKYDEITNVWVGKVIVNVAVVYKMTHSKFLYSPHFSTLNLTKLDVSTLYCL